MSLFPLKGSIPRDVPISNRDAERWAAKHLAEARRAREQDSPIRETWHVDRMDAWLDVLLQRGYGQAA
jgi:hypothetical protein